MKDNTKGKMMNFFFKIKQTKKSKFMHKKKKATYDNNNVMALKEMENNTKGKAIIKLKAELKEMDTSKPHEYTMTSWYLTECDCMERLCHTYAP